MRVASDGCLEFNQARNSLLPLGKDGDPAERHSAPGAHHSGPGLRQHEARAPAAT